MKIFYIDIDEFKQKFDKNFLELYSDLKIKTEKRFYEYTTGRYLVKNVLEKVYNINDEIVLGKNGKPELKKTDFFFSISHSKNIVIACFDKYPCGIDVEYMKDKDLKELSQYFDRTFDTPEDFYKFWTLKEAVFKSGQKEIHSKTQKFKKNFCLTVVSDKQLKCLNIVDYMRTFIE